MEKVFRIVSKKDRHTDREYWLSRTPQERLDALEELRMQYIHYLYPDALPRLQRVYRVVNMKETGRHIDPDDIRFFDEKI